MKFYNEETHIIICFNVFSLAHFQRCVWWLFSRQSFIVSNSVVFICVVIPLAVLTQPYFQQEMPSYVPYGTMGLIFTHEILHAFDLTGTYLNTNVWTNWGERDSTLYWCIKEYSTASTASDKLENLFLT